MSLKVVGIGEVLWDILPSGPQLGGAPANFAYHAKNLGADAQVITRVGNDVFGREILRRFDGWGLDKRTVQVDQTLPTGQASVSLEAGGVPVFVIGENVAWDNLALTEEALEAARQADVICFGSLAQRSEASAAVIKQVLAAASFDAVRILDINLRQKFYHQPMIERSLGMASVLKLNDQELNILARMFALTGTVNQQIEQLAGKFDLQLIALTRGAQGSLLYRAGAWSDLPAEPLKIADTVGAGDAFTAGMAMGLVAGLSLDQTHRLASEIARHVCSQPGATPAMPGNIREEFARHCPGA
jgi:fructokinase